MRHGLGGREMMRAGGVLALGLSAALLVFAPGACAQTPPPAPPVPAAPTPEALADAKRFYDEGVKAADASQWETAREQFLSSWRIRQHWKIAANLGRAEMKLNRYRDAAEHLTFFLREAPPEVPAEDRKATQQMLDKAKAKVGALTIRVNLPGAEVVVDGQVVGNAPLPGPVFVDPGQVFVEARLEGFARSRVGKVAVAGKEEMVSLQLAKLALGEKDEAAVVGASGPLAAPGDTAATPGRTRASLPVIVGGYVVGAVGIATGIALFVVANQKASSANAQLVHFQQTPTACSQLPPPSGCATLHATNVSADTFHNASIPFLAIGSGVAAATVMYMLWPRAKTERGPAVQIAPVAGTTGTGVWLTGEF
jgi:hypothetical protein